MFFTCEYCTKELTSQVSLQRHQKSTKYCLKIQQKNNKEINIEQTNFKCEFCNKNFSSKQKLNSHIEKSCSQKLTTVIENYESKLLDKDFLINQQKEENLKLQTENDLLHKQLENLTSKDVEKISELQDKLQEIAIVAIDQKNEVISSMVKKYVKKQPRKKFDCSNVVYILTTTSLKKDRRYILGKAKNLTNRLSTYNKTDEHEVIFYQVCDDEESMNALEPLVFKKLGEYREQANRERFILPDNNNIDLFIDTIKNCFEFLK